MRASLGVGGGIIAAGRAWNGAEVVMEGICCCMEETAGERSIGVSVPVMETSSWFAE